MLRVYAREFVTVCNHLERAGCRKTRLYFYADKEMLFELLDKNNYETGHNKLKFWKALRWLDADDKHLTKLAFDGRSGKNTRVYAIRIDVYLTLKQMMEAAKT